MELQEHSNGFRARKFHFAQSFAIACYVIKSRVPSGKHAEIFGKDATVSSVCGGNSAGQYFYSTVCKRGHYLFRDLLICDNGLYPVLEIEGHSAVP